MSVGLSARFSKILTKCRILCLTRFTLAHMVASQQKDVKGLIGATRCMKTIGNFPTLRTAFQAISFKINVLQADGTPIGG
jgi:hypothetical protein